MYKAPRLTLAPLAKPLAFSAVGLMLAGLTACSALSVYRIDIPQGTPLTQTQATQVQVGMSQQQVRYLLGTPSLTDTLNPLRWDYLYDYKAGTYARKAHTGDAHGQHLVIYFDAGGNVERIEGLQTLPTKQVGLPASRDIDLNAPPL